MPFFDFGLDALRDYRPDVAEPADFDEFWARTLAENPLDMSRVSATVVESPLVGLAVTDIRFPGYGGDPIAAWLITPAGAGPLPAVVSFIGYGGGRGFPEEHLVWASAGYANLVVDTRGQGGGFGSGGNTPDGGYAGGPSTAGFMTRGIESPDTYYYRRVYTDAHNAVELAANLDVVDPDRIAVAGASQGGALSIAASSLNPRVAATLADVPFLCHFERAIGLTGSQPYAEIPRFLSVNRHVEADAYRTLSYIDGVNMGKRANSPALFSTGLMDTVCPPSTVFAMKNHYGGESEIEVYRFNAHEGGGIYQVRRQLAWLGRLFAPSR